ncbi:DUF3850 domain-containing protein [Aeromicrobium endophyticum]|uniref:DUF3850 domain-containing protein n=1 Tax=Aeromicrobium endophyticum TaxID=2292704 RepID=A0A371PCL0_9ACTN|nr:DUF3850 domain-containing protein [Aeromicrobium endophyticum]REK73663.1 DUF3850 domain-containing protein [Aeromicrobium endophyticum]
MSVHFLKTREPWYSRVVDGQKTVEIRTHDRDYQVGDELVLVRTVHELSSSAEQILERDNDDTQAVVVEVTHVAPASLIGGLIGGFCALSIRLVGDYDRGAAA